MPAFFDDVNLAMTKDDSIDNKCIVVSSGVAFACARRAEWTAKSKGGVCSMTIVSPRLRLAFVAIASLVAAAWLGGCPWGP